jgi:hypothetical protein
MARPFNLTDRVRSNNSRSLYGMLFFFALFLSAGAITHFYSEAAFITQIESLPIVCPLRRLTGLLCSFCGMTHAWIYFWHGDFLRAMEENKLALPLFFLTPVLALSIGATSFWTEPRIRKSGIGFMMMLLAYAVLRNL